MKSKSIIKATTFTYTAFVASILFLISCGGCGSGKVVGDQDYPKVSDSSQSNSIPISIVEDTISQIWQDQHYYRGTKITLPDSLKSRKGLGTKFWYSLPDDSYKAIVFDNAGDPKIEVTQIHFIDSTSRLVTSSLTLYEHNPYKDLPFRRISNDRLMKVDGIIRYDLANKAKKELRDLLRGMGVNIDTVTTKIVGAEVMTGNNSPEERTSLAVSYAIQVIDELGQIIANQTTYKIYDRFGVKKSEIIENGHGLHQFAITRDGKHLGAVFGGRYGCRSGQYLPPYFKIFKTDTAEFIHKEDMEISNGVSARFDYITIRNGGPVGNEYYTVYLIKNKLKFVLNFKDHPYNKDWKEHGVLTRKDKYEFYNSDLYSTVFNTK
jgi:hypothetical protein